MASNEKGFHTKAYIFENKDEYKIIIGSSNITQRALKSNVEWNVKVVSKKDDSFTREVLEEYLGLWEATTIVDDEFLNSYSSFLKEIKKTQVNKSLELNSYELIKPNYMQKKAMDNLSRLRASGEDKALVIAATGTGKTYMSAFDVIRYKPKKILYLVHREEILRSAEKTFKKLIKNKDKITGLLTGTSKEIDPDYLFSTVQSMNNQLENFKHDEFEYIVVYEAHHASSPSYEKVINQAQSYFLRKRVRFL